MQQGSFTLNVPPWLGMAFSAVIACLSFLMASGAVLTDLFGAGPEKKIIGVTSLAFGMLSAISGVLFAGSNSKPGPLATPDPQEVVDAHKVAEARMNVVPFPQKAA
jgi:hypothetical protein